MSSNIKNWKLFIADYFDSLIRQIDIYTEQILLGYSDEDIFEINPSEHQMPTSSPPLPKTNELVVDFHSFDINSNEFSSNSILKAISKHPYFDDLEDNDNLNQSGQERIKVMSYVNQIRSQLIDELNEAQTRTLKYYETIREEINDNDMSRDEIESRLFAKDYYFTLTLNNKEEEDFHDFGSPFKMHLVKLDFYLNARERDILG